jgi:hypothetical protein
MLRNPAHASQAQLHAQVDSGKLRCVGYLGQESFSLLSQIAIRRTGFHADTHKVSRPESER